MGKMVMEDGSSSAAKMPSHGDGSNGGCIHGSPLYMRHSAVLLLLSHR